MASRIKRYVKPLGIIAIVVAARPSVAPASSDAAWATLRADVARACTSEAKKHFADPIVSVDQFGSARFGIALIYARDPVGKGATPSPVLSTTVCVYDKKAKTAELSGTFRTVNP